MVMFGRQRIALAHQFAGHTKAAGIEADGGIGVLPCECRLAFVARDRGGRGKCHKGSIA